MKKILFAIIFSLLISTSSYAAQPITGQLMNGRTASGAFVPILVDETGKLYGLGGGGGSNNLASDSLGNLLVHIASSSILLASPVALDTASRTLVTIASNTTVYVASISTGIVLQDVRSIASNTNTNMSDICSGTTAPFWLMIRNTGVQKIHVDSIAPGDTTDYIAPGEQYGPIYCGSNVLNEKFRANSAGTSTWALTIRK